LPSSHCSLPSRTPFPHVPPHGWHSVPTQHPAHELVSQVHELVAQRWPDAHSPLPSQPHVPLRHAVPALLVVQSTHAPPDPHAVALVPDWHSPPPQQPVAHAPSFDPPQAPAQEPPVQVGVRPPHAWQAAPPDPHSALVSTTRVRHFPEEQQPAHELDPHPHVPSTHPSALPHDTPALPPPAPHPDEAPQYRLLVNGSMQKPLQSTSPLTHVVAHLPPEHASPLGHPLLHVPQLALSDAGSTHCPLHKSSPDMHAVAHLPAEHAWPLGQTVSQVPQWALSDAGSTHCPLHRSSPEMHVVEHLPAEHTWPLGHAWPHTPQLALSDSGFLHCPPQLISPGAHDFCASVGVTSAAASAETAVAVSGEHALVLDAEMAATASNARRRIEGIMGPGRMHRTFPTEGLTIPARRAASGAQNCPQALDSMRKLCAAANVRTARHRPAMTVARRSRNKCVGHPGAFAAHDDRAVADEGLARSRRWCWPTRGRCPCCPTAPRSRADASHAMIRSNRPPDRPSPATCARLP